MKRVAIDIDSLSEINPHEISSYLISKGWKQLKSRQDSIIWEMSIADRTARILLPLNKNIPDFCDRIYDLIRAVSSVENRPESEVLLSIRTSLEIAKLKKRQIIRFRLSSGFGIENGIPAKRLGPILVNFQSLINSIAQYEEGKATASGAIPQYIIDKTQFSVTSTFEGSFGITLENELPEDGDQKSLLEESLIQRSLRSFMQLLKASKKEATLKEKLVIIKKRAASNYRNFLMTLSDAGTDNVFEWGSPDTEESERVELSLSDIVNAFEVASKTVTEEPNEIEILKAEWIGGNSRREDFEVKDIDTDITYVGHVSAQAMANAKLAVWHGIYTAKIQEEIEIVQSTQEIKRKYTLLFLEPYVEEVDEKET